MSITNGGHFLYFCYEQSSLLQIVAGGNIVLVNFLEMTSLQKTFSVALSRDMVPSSRLVAYYIINGEVVADALNFHVNGTIMNEVKCHYMI